jgi:hypothetical protein
VDSDRVSRARPYSGNDEGRARPSAYGALTLCSQPFQAARLERAFVTSPPGCGPAPSSLQPRTGLGPQAWHPIGLGSSPFARHYSGSRGFFPFLRLLRCVTSPAYLPAPYVFRRGYARITARGFPHSEIRGSKVVQHLTAAYRSRPRPSSASDAKASTACPSYLDDRAHL